jgi:2-keto-3-deoxy-L-fuconate dehydrogenase
MELLSMVKCLEGRTALITAAGQGIGFATAMAFADAGATIIATDINPKGLEELSREHPSVLIHKLDVTDSAAIATPVNELDRVDVLFNCVGYVHNGSILECDEREWKRSLDLNITPMFHACRAVLPGMIARKQGSIINVASVVSSVKGAPKRFAYGTSKAAVVGLTKSIAADFVQFGIRCNALCPGTIDTPSLEERMAAVGDLDAARQAFVARQPMGRLGTPQEIARAALYLASDDSSFMTGQAFVIDGGWSI